MNPNGNITKLYPILSFFITIIFFALNVQLHPYRMYGKFPLLFSYCAEQKIPNDGRRTPVHWRVIGYSTGWTWARLNLNLRGFWCQNTFGKRPYFFPSDLKRFVFSGSSSTVYAAAATVVRYVHTQLGKGSVPRYHGVLLFCGRKDDRQDHLEQSEMTASTVCKGEKKKKSFFFLQKIYSSWFSIESPSFLIHTHSTHLS